MKSAWTPILRSFCATHCWFPTQIPNLPVHWSEDRAHGSGTLPSLPPLNTRSESHRINWCLIIQSNSDLPPMKPPLPFSMNIPIQMSDLRSRCHQERLALVVVAGRSAHVHDNVHERGGLRDLPVQTGRGRGSRHPGEVDNEVPDTPEEVVLVDWRAGCQRAVLQTRSHVAYHSTEHRHRWECRDQHLQENEHNHRNA